MKRYEPKECDVNEFTPTTESSTNLFRAKLMKNPTFAQGKPKPTKITDAFGNVSYDMNDTSQIEPVVKIPRRKLR